jgi:type II secretory pathway component PulC
MKNSGILSVASAVEQNTISRPDELERILRQTEAETELELEKTRRTKEMEIQFSNSTTKTEE